jgi:hypothetical protein
MQLGNLFEDKAKLKSQKSKIGFGILNLTFTPGYER